VRDTRSGELLLATGSGSHGIQASPLEDDVDVKVGDHLVTGPVGGTTFVHGIEVGTVSSVTTSSSGTVSVALRPTASQTSLDLVGIVLEVPRAPARAPLAADTGR
jgi:cell shape-determining protein MreC